MIKKILMIIGTQRTLVVEGHESLAEVLRDRLLLTGCKIGCGEGHCGACNVIVDGKVTPLLYYQNSESAGLCKN